MYHVGQRMFPHVAAAAAFMVIATIMLAYQVAVANITVRHIKRTTYLLRQMEKQASTKR